MRMSMAVGLALVSVCWGQIPAGGEGIESIVVPHPRVAPVPAAILPAAQVATNPTSAVVSGRQFVIKCELTRPGENGERKPLAAPWLVVAEGQEGTVAIAGQRPFVTAVRGDSEGTSQPIVTTLAEGITGCFTVTSLDDDHVLVDACVTVSSIDRVDEVQTEGHTTQAPQQTTSGWRVVRTVKLGESIVVASGADAPTQAGEYVARVTIDRVSADEAAITPIRSAETDATEQGDHPQLYTVVYQVADLLQPRTPEQATGNWEHIDFVPLVDMVVSESMTAWPDEAQIRPYPENGSLVITQTEAGHEKIGRLLRDKRDNIAAIERLMR